VELSEALKAKPRTERKDDTKLRMYLVLDGDAAKVVKQALAKIGVNSNYAGFLKQAVLEKIQREIAAQKQQKS